MTEDSDQDPPRACQKRVQPLLDCVAYLLAKRWLRDQRQQADKPPQRRPEPPTKQGGA